MKYFYSFFVLAIFCAACSNSPRRDLSLVPYPNQLKVETGSFTLQPSTRLVINDNGQFGNEIDFFQSLCKKMLGSSLSSEKGKNTIEICQSDTFSVAESYSIKISSEKITLSAGDAAGMLYAMETLRQLFPEKEETVSAIVFPVLNISDYPVFHWRGMHLDVSRHFFSIDYLKRYVDLLALYKMNKLHLHLTDDQGWRLEIKKYPELTENGAWRTFNNQDSVCMQKAKENSIFAFDPEQVVVHDGKTLYGGFYTQDQMRNLVKYAQERHVEIIPEIDMPGHMMAAIRQYPELSCSGKAQWGKVFSTPLCPVDDKVYSFVEDVLEEVTQIFPSKYIHIGADEVDKTSWEKSEACKRFLKAKGFSNFDQLHGYFVHRVADFLKAKGKEVIVWDDALEGNIDSTLNVMYWRSWAAAIPERTVKNGNNLIIAVGDPFYFSYEGKKLYDIYNKKVLSPKFPVDKTNKIMGLQACLWTETIPSERVADAAIFPKALAMAERCWTNPQVRNWTSFKSRMKGQLGRLASLGVHYLYAPTDELLPILDIDTLQRRIGISFESEIDHPTIYYTTDGSVPTISSNRYDGEFYVTGRASVCAAVFKDGKLSEPILRKKVDYHQAIGKRVTYYQPWNNSYPAGDAGALTDGYRGGDSYNDGKWQGFTNDLDVMVDLGKEEELNTFSATFMQYKGPGVFMPDYVDVSVSTDGTTFKKVLHINNDISSEEEKLTFKDFAGSLNKEKARFVKVLARNEKRAFIFTDELVIN